MLIPKLRRVRGFPVVTGYPTGDLQLTPLCREPRERTGPGPGLAHRRAFLPLLVAVLFHPGAPVRSPPLSVLHSPSTSNPAVPFQQSVPAAQCLRALQVLFLSGLCPGVWELQVGDVKWGQRYREQGRFQGGPHHCIWFISRLEQGASCFFLDYFYKKAFSLNTGTMMLVR